MTERPAGVLFPVAYPQVAAHLAGRSLISGVAPEDLAPGDRARVRVMVVSGVARLGAATLDLLPNLGLIVAIGAGYDGVDVDAASARGVRLVSGAGANAEDVADWAVGALVAMARRMIPYDAEVRAGGWVRGRWTPVRALSSLSVGIVGLGHIGRAAARRLEPFRCRLAWTGPRPKPDAPWPYVPDILALARDSDVLVLAAPLSADTAGLVDAGVIASLGPQGLLVNVGRGGLVDEDALIAALKAGRLAGAALDVFAEEPTPPARWADVPNVLLSPHTAAVTDAAMAAVYATAARNAAEFLDAEAA